MEERNIVTHFRDDADHNYKDHLEHSGEITVAAPIRKKALERFPTVMNCLTDFHVVSGYEDSKIEEVTGIAIIRGVLCAAENAVSKALEDAGLYSVEDLVSTQYEGEEIDEAVIKGNVIMEYQNPPQRFIVEVVLPLDDYKDDAKLETFIKHLLPGPKTFEIEQFELHVTTYRVTAMNRADAIAKVLNGNTSEAELIGTNYSQISNEYGMSRDELEPHEISIIEAEAQIRFSEGHIDSIRAVRSV